MKVGNIVRHLNHGALGMVVEYGINGRDSVKIYWITHPSPRAVENSRWEHTLYLEVLDENR